jgi:hypothetical protein
MQIHTIAAIAALVWSAAAPAATVPTPTRLTAPTLSAAQVVEKNIAARGGLEAWRRIETMSWTGRVESAGRSGPAMPFLLELKRPNQTRFEITSVDKRFARIFDGSRGWRIRPGNAGAPDVKAFSKEEAAFAREEFVIEGPLVDHEAKGVNLTLAGVDEMEGRKAYLLVLKLPSGAERRTWIDAETFLELRTDRPSSNPLIKGAPISVYYREYRSIDGVQIPMVIETRNADTTPAQRLVIEKVALNPALPEQAFAKPATTWQRHAIVRVGGDAPHGQGVVRPSP